MAHGEALRIRVIKAVVEDGLSRNEAARIFRVGIASAIRWVKEFEETRRTAALPTGGVLKPHRDWLLELRRRENDLTLDAIASMPEEKQKDQHSVTFESLVPVQIMAIDGTWRRRCILKQVSEAGGMLAVEGSVQGLNLREFFLLLLSTGLAYRRCEVDHINGDEMTVAFLRRRGKQKEKSQEPAELLAD
jgi:transposase-like protein